MLTEQEFDECMRSINDATRRIVNDLVGTWREKRAEMIHWMNQHADHAFSECVSWFTDEIENDL